MNNPFQNLSNDNLEAPKDTLGGQFGAIDSNAYPAKIKAAYAGESTGGAKSLSMVFEVQVAGQKRELRQTLYVTSGRDKGQNNYYEKDGKKNPLPGFVVGNDLALLSTGFGLNEQEWEERVINVYNFDQGKELPTKVLMATNMVGKDVTIGVLRQTVVKNVKDASGKYVPGNETRDENEIDKVFHTASGRTVSEVSRKLEAGEFLPQWIEKNAGVTRDKTKGKSAAGQAGVPGGGAPAAAAKSGSGNLFG